MASLDHHIAATRAHLDNLKREVDGLGEPCWKCRFGNKADWTYGRTCKNPLVSRGYVNTVTRKVTWSRGIQDEVRGYSGACGPDGKLFEQAPAMVIAWRGFPKWIFGVIAFVAYVAALVVLP